MRTPRFSRLRTMDWSRTFSKRYRNSSPRCRHSAAETPLFRGERPEPDDLLPVGIGRLDASEGFLRAGLVLGAQLVDTKHEPGFHLLVGLQSTLANGTLQDGNCLV